MHAPQSSDDGIEDSISLFTKPSELCFLANTEMLGERTTDIQNYALSEEGKENDVIGDEDKVKVAFSKARIIRVACWGRSRVGYKKHGGERAWRWVINKQRGNVCPLKVQDDWYEQHTERGSCKRISRLKEFPMPIKNILGTTTQREVFKSSQKPLDFGIPIAHFGREACRRNEEKGDTGLRDASGGGVPRGLIQWSIKNRTLVKGRRVVLTSEA